MCRQGKRINDEVGGTRSGLKGGVDEQALGANSIGSDVGREDLALETLSRGRDGDKPRGGGPWPLSCGHAFPRKGKEGKGGEGGSGECR